MRHMTNDNKTCTVEGCDRPLHGTTYCQAHYKRFKKYGDPLGEPPTKGRKGKPWTEEERARRDERKAAREAGLLKPIPYEGDRTECRHGHKFDETNVPYVNPTQIALGKAPYPQCPKCRNISQKRTQYGLKKAKYEEMLAQQPACSICLREFTENRRPHVDHCHETGKVRGLLCGSCNTGLGHFRDDPELLKAAIRYLADHASC